jgi:class 3 adenylate cyclase
LAFESAQKKAGFGLSRRHYATCLRFYPSAVWRQDADRRARSLPSKGSRVLLNILPGPVADELKENGYVKPVLFPSATILFTDFVSFSSITEKMSPEELVKELDRALAACGFTFIDEAH